jgi:hypothetical protein
LKNNSVTNAIALKNTHPLYFLAGVLYVFIHGEHGAIGKQLEIHQQPHSPLYYQSFMGSHHFLSLLFLLHPVFRKETICQIPDVLNSVKYYIDIPADAGSQFLLP